MNAESFAYWLQGFIELNGSAPTANQWQSIKEHLQLVFKKVTPPAVTPGLRQPFMPEPLYDPLQHWNAPKITCDTNAAEPNTGKGNTHGYDCKITCDMPSLDKFNKACQLNGHGR